MVCSLTAMCDGSHGLINLQPMKPGVCSKMKAYRPKYGIENKDVLILGRLTHMPVCTGRPSAVGVEIVRVACLGKP